MRQISILGFVLLAIPSFVFATGLVNINTADGTTLETLPHIGQTLANRIIAYRTQNGLFATIEDLQKVSGIGSGSNYADIAPLITVSDASAPVLAAASTTDSTSATPPQGSATAYVPPPSTLSVQVDGVDVATLEVPLQLSAQVTAKNGIVDSSARILWSFGDGSRAEGSAIEKTYRYAGTYLVKVIATDGPARATDEFIVTARPAAVSSLLVSGDGITIVNDADERLDLSGWRLLADTGLFRIPEGTIILPKARVLFPFAITNLPVTFDAALAYPDGIIAVRTASSSSAIVTTMTASAPIRDEQLPEHIVSSIPVQKVEPIISVTTKVRPHEEAALAPAASTELAAAGAASSPDQASSSPVHTKSVFTSPWTLGLFGIMTLAGGAFILL